MNAPGQEITQVAVREITGLNWRIRTEQEFEVIERSIFSIDTGKETLRIRDAEVPVDEYAEILVSLGTVRIPLHGLEGGAGLDGSRYGVEYDVDFGRVRLAWWEDHPKEWLPFTSKIRKLQKFLHQCVEQANHE